MAARGKESAYHAVFLWWREHGWGASVAVGLALVAAAFVVVVLDVNELVLGAGLAPRAGVFGMLLVLLVLLGLLV
jgi:hypothetical protein